MTEEQVEKGITGRRNSIKGKVWNNTWGAKEWCLDPYINQQRVRWEVRWWAHRLPCVLCWVWNSLWTLESDWRVLGSWETWSDLHFKSITFTGYHLLPAITSDSPMCDIFPWICPVVMARFSSPCLRKHVRKCKWEDIKRIWSTKKLAMALYLSLLSTFFVKWLCCFSHQHMESQLALCQDFESQLALCLVLAIRVKWK